MFRKKFKKAGALILAVCVTMGSVQFPVLTAKASDENLARSAAATASSVETNDFPASKANDGDDTTRWASATGSGVQTLQLAWDSAQTMKGFVIKWERRNATDYAIETSSDGSSWTEVAGFTQKPQENVQRITLDAPVQAQYVRLNIKAHASAGLGDETSYNNVSVYELEVYEGEIPDNRTDAEKLLDRVTAPQISEDGTHISMPELGDGVNVRFCADYEQVIGEDGTIYKPLSDKTVKGFYEVSLNGEKANSVEYTVMVPGRYAPEENANAKPSVVPELQEWYGVQGQFAISAGSKIVADQELADVAEKFAEDYEKVTGSPIQTVTGGIKDVSAGDFYLTLGTAEKGLGKEGYLLKIGNAVLVEASDAVGVYWGVISILQILNQTRGVIPRGIVRDYPKFEVRAFSFDVGRKPFDLETLYDFARNMSWYKMNSLQLHLSDNLIFHEDYPNLETAIAQSYAGFRLESDKKNDETGVTLTSQDMYYTKEEFKEFVKDTQTRGVSVVPEFDMPAHALAITRVFEEYMSKTPGAHGWLIEELNLENEDSFAWAKSIWQEYFDGGEDAVFADIDTIHIGTDEYHGVAGQVGIELFRRFSKEMIEFVQGTKTADGKTRTVRSWGSLTDKAGTTPVPSENVQLNIWNVGYADPQVMYDMGYEMINTLEGPNYIVPAAGYYNDYINAQSIYNTWKPNNIGNLYASAGDDQILGGCYAIWHDSIDTRANGISQYDSFDRFYQPLPAYSAKLWGEAEDRTYAELQADVEKIGTAPGTKVYGEVKSVTKTVLDYTFDEALTEDSSANSYDAADSKNVAQADSDSSKALKLNGGESYLTTSDEIDKIGGNATLTMRVKMDADAEGEQILCESKDAFGAYGTYAIKAVQKHTGKVGFSREGYDYSFNYTLPKGEWVELTFKGGKDTPDLYVNGELIDNKKYDENGNLLTVRKGNGDTVPVSKNNNPDIYFANHETTELSTKLAQTGITKIATMMLPVGRIGSTTKSFKGLIDGVTVSAEKAITGDYSSAAVPQGEMTASGCSDHSEGRFPNVLDGDPDTYWHTDWSQASEKDATKDHDHYLTLTFNNDAAKTINMLSYLPRQNGTNGRITQYSIDITKADGTVETNYASGTWAADMTEKIAVFEPIEAKSVKLNILVGEGTHGTAAELNLYHVSVDKDEVTAALAPYKNLNSSDYTAQSWEAVTEAIATVEAIAGSENSTVQDTFVAYGIIQSLDGLLVRKPEATNNVETSELQTKQEERADELKKIDESLYTEESVALLKEYLREAEKILKNPVTKAEVADIMAKLEVTLVERPADMESISSIVAEAEKVNLKEYTAESAAEYAKALENLKKILGNPNALYKEAKPLLEAFEAAKAKLQKIVVPNPGNPNPGNPNPGNPNPARPIFGNGAEAVSGNGRYKVINSKNKTAKLVSVINKKKATLNVPATVKIAGVTCKVTEVGASVMKGNTKLKKVVLGKNVTTISKQAFMGCKNLKSVQLKGKALKSIKSGAFKKTSGKLVVSAKKMSKKQKAKLLKQLKKAGAAKKTKVK